MLLFLTITGGIVLTLGDIVMKYWIETNTKLLFLFGILIYVIGEVIMAFGFKYGNIAVVSVMMVIINVIALSVLSLVFFHEKMSLMAVAGIVLGIFSVVLLEMS